MKTNKHQTLLLVKEKSGVQARDLVRAFQYTPGTARSYLSYLGRQGLLERTDAGHVLTSKGQDRLNFFEVDGCTDVACPLCQGKVGFYTCPSCGKKLSKKLARLKPTWDTVFFKREAGVYCPICQGQIFMEEQARLLRIQQEVS